MSKLRKYVVTPEAFQKDFLWQTFLKEENKTKVAITSLYWL